MFFSKRTLVAGFGAATMLLSGPAAVATFAQVPAPEVVQVNQGNLISALNNIAVNIDRLNALNNLTIGDVKVVNVEDVLNNNRVLNNALNRNDVDINILRNVLNNSVNNNNVEIIKQALNNNNVLVSDVVAIDVLSGGDVIVFHQ